MTERRLPRAPARRGPPQRRGSLLSTLVSAAVTAVVVGSVATGVLVKLADTSELQVAVFEPAVTGPSSATQPVAVAGEVVTAPPLRRLPPPLAKAAADEGPPPATQILGGAPACPHCGVVEAVVAMHESGQAQPRAYQMHIRMDDGTVRAVQHRGALPAGSRVMVEGATLRLVVAAP